MSIALSSPNTPKGRLNAVPAIVVPVIGLSCAVKSKSGCEPVKDPDVVYEYDISSANIFPPLKMAIAKKIKSFPVGI